MISVDHQSPTSTTSLRLARDHSVSPFAYGGNNPVMFNDPAGLSPDPAGLSRTQTRSLYWTHSTTYSNGYNQWATDTGFGGIYDGAYAIDGPAAGFSALGKLGSSESVLSLLKHYGYLRYQNTSIMILFEIRAGDALAININSTRG